MTTPAARQILNENKETHVEGKLSGKVVHATGMHETQGVANCFGAQNTLACYRTNTPIGQCGSHDTSWLTGYLYRAQLEWKNETVTTTEETDLNTGVRRSHHHDTADVCVYTFTAIYAEFIDWHKATLLMINKNTNYRCSAVSPESRSQGLPSYLHCQESTEQMRVSVRTEAKTLNTHLKW